MQVEIKIDDSCIEPRVIIITDKVNDEINDILNTLSSKTPEIITGFYNDLAEILSPDNIIHIYSAGGKTFASVSKKEYILRQRLYELEEQLTKHSFVRISNSEFIRFPLLNLSIYQLNTAAHTQIMLTFPCFCPYEVKQGKAFIRQLPCRAVGLRCAWLLSKRERKCSLWY